MSVVVLAAFLGGDILGTAPDASPTPALAALVASTEPTASPTPRPTRTPAATTRSTPRPTAVPSIAPASDGAVVPQLTGGPTSGAANTPMPSFEVRRRYLVKEGDTWRVDSAGPVPGTSQATCGGGVKPGRSSRRRRWSSRRGPWSRRKVESRRKMDLARPRTRMAATRSPLAGPAPGGDEPARRDLADARPAAGTRLSALAMDLQEVAHLHLEARRHALAQLLDRPRRAPRGSPRRARRPLRPPGTSACGTAPAGPPTGLSSQ